MSTNAHRRSELLMARPDSAQVVGRLDEARALYREAAVLETEAFKRIPLERPRTRGILGVSAVSLFRLAGDPAEAIRHVRRYLADTV